MIWYKYWYYTIFLFMIQYVKIKHQTKVLLLNYLV